MKEIPNPADLRGSEPMDELPFYRWLKAQETPPNDFIAALGQYFDTPELRGKLTDAQAQAYEHVYRYFWRVKFKSQRDAS